MHALATPVALAALAILPAVSAHGYVGTVIVNGVSYPGASPQWYYDSVKPTQAGWFAYNQDNGFVAPDEYTDNNITCHKGATPGNTYIPVTAGSAVELQWNTWPSSHHGPVIDYLANCNGACTTVNKEDLNFFKVDAGGLVNDTSPPGTWATDTLIANNFTWTFTVPSTIAAGNYVLRHEIIALHSAGNTDGAQNYPNCLNLQITGSGTVDPCTAGATCKKGVALYTETDPGILVDIYEALANYTIPGPPVWASLKKRAHDFRGYLLW